MTFFQESLKQVVIALAAVAASLCAWSALGHYAAGKLAEKCKNAKPIEFQVKPLEFKTFDSKSLIWNPGGQPLGGVNRNTWKPGS
jgi:hypothetical protein